MIKEKEKWLFLSFIGGGMSRFLVILILIVLGCGSKNEKALPTAALISSTDNSLTENIFETNDQYCIADNVTALKAFRVGSGKDGLEIGTYADQMMLRLLSVASGTAVVSLRDCEGIGILEIGSAYSTSVNTSILPNLIKVSSDMGSVQLSATGNSGSISINNYQVLGPRLAAIDNATSPEDMVVKFNLLLEAMRTHGLIERGAGR